MHQTNKVANRLIQAYLDKASEEEIEEILEDCHPLWRPDARRKARQQIRMWYLDRRRFSWCTVRFPERNS